MGIFLYNYKFSFTVFNMFDLFYRGIVLLSGKLIHFYDFILSVSALVHMALDFYHMLLVVNCLTRFWRALGLEIANPICQHTSLQKA